MVERAARRLRPTGVWMRVVATLSVLPLLLAGCGDDGASDRPAKAAARTSVADCLVATLGPRPTVDVDLDGDNTVETVEDVAGKGNGHCARAYLEVEVAGKTRLAAVPDDLGIAPNGMRRISVPGRAGDLVLAVLSHPRGGFQAHLYGYADGKLEELTVDGRPVFPFVATDTVTDPISAACTHGGFEVTRAQAHQPIGVVPAWDVERTTYAVDGNTVTVRATSEIADNVLDKQLRRDYRPLLQYSLFANCRVGR